MLQKALHQVKDRIQFSFIYGSVARGEESFNSDLDLFIVGDLGIRDVASLLGKVGHELGREINPTVYSMREFKKKIKENSNFIKEIMRNPKIWLIGEESEFAKMVQ